MTKDYLQGPYGMCNILKQLKKWNKTKLQDSKYSIINKITYGLSFIEN